MTTALTSCPPSFPDPAELFMRTFDSPAFKAKAFAIQERIEEAMSAGSTNASFSEEECPTAAQWLLRKDGYETIVNWDAPTERRFTVSWYPREFKNTP